MNDLDNQIKALENKLERLDPEGKVYATVEEELGRLEALRTQYESVEDEI